MSYRDGMWGKMTTDGKPGPRQKLIYRGA